MQNTMASWQTRVGDSNTQPTIRGQESPCGTASNPILTEGTTRMQHETDQTDTRFSHYEYYILGGVTPVRFLVDQTGGRYGAEKPGEDKNTWVAVPTMLSKLESTPEGFNSVGKNEFEQHVRDFVPHICTSSIKSGMWRLRHSKHFKMVRDAYPT